MKNVLVVLGDYGVSEMFVNNGFTLVKEVSQADLICFTGGEDVDPSYYGEKNVASYTRISRDQYEAKVLAEAKVLGIPCVGICRGGQFLNVMAGGKMWQDVNNHGGTHGVLVDGVVFQCSSTHHQMMRVGPDSEVIGIACPQLSSRKTNADGTVTSSGDLGDDVEIVYHPKINALSFQPHPEFFQPDHECQKLFFSLINKYLA